MLCCRDGRVDELHRLIEANEWYRINEPLGYCEYTALQEACYRLQADIVRYLLSERHADPNVFVQGQTALHRVCSVERTSDAIEPLVLRIVQLLIAARANVNRPTALSETPLMMAIRGGYDTVVEYMLQTRLVSLEMADRENRTAILWAVEHNRPAIVRRLVELGVNMDIVNGDGSTPSQLAAERGLPELQTLLPHVEHRAVPVQYASMQSIEDFVPTAFPQRVM